MNLPKMGLLKRILTFFQYNGVEIVYDEIDHVRMLCGKPSLNGVLIHTKKFRGVTYEVARFPLRGKVK